MVKPIVNQYSPDDVSPPGETLQETLDTIGMPQAELARRMGKTPKNINEIIKGKAPICPATALELERVLGITAGFWGNRERDYREALARQKEQERLQSLVTWLETIPVSAMAKKGWIPSCRDKVQKLQEVLNFFGVVDPQQWEDLWNTGALAAFRKSPAFRSKPGAVAAWLRKGELDAQRLQCGEYDESRFRGALKTLRSLTADPPEEFCPEIVRHCADAGVAVVFVPQLPGTRASGATRWLTPRKALIQLSLRYKTTDHLWFTFFHEAGHILRHGKRDVFLDELTGQEGDKEEDANTFAGDFLIPPREYEQLISSGSLTKDKVRQFASRIGVAPGIVVGRLQHEKQIPYSHLNNLKLPLKWSTE